MARLEGKVAVVTGASKGIGAGIAKEFGAQGAAVVVNYASDKKGADTVVAAINQNGGKALAVQGDMSKAADVAKLFDQTRKAFGKLDVLVNNAGVFQFDPLEKVTEGEFHRQYNTNVLGPILATRESLKYFGAEGGSVINISSVAGLNPPPTASVYSGTKGALDAITKSLAAELGPRKIRVNSLNPGMTISEGTQRLGIIGSDFEKEMVAKTPLGRVGIPDDIAKVATFLASSDSAWVTGETLMASGGLR